MRSSIQIEEIAAQWMARRDADGWSAADEIELTAWLETSVAHRVAFVRLQAAWQLAGRLKCLDQVSFTEEAQALSASSLVAR